MKQRSLEPNQRGKSSWSFKTGFSTHTFYLCSLNGKQLPIKRSVLRYLLSVFQKIYDWDKMKLGTFKYGYPT